MPNAGLGTSTPLEAAVVALSGASRVVIFTGAGASADSGIGTFRGAGGGAWSGLMGMLSLVWGGTPIGWRLTPSYVWKRFITDFYGPIAAAAPHAGHEAFVRLADGGRLPVETITMNVDGLHQAAGAPAHTVWEVHGSVRRFRCCGCKRTVLLAGKQLDASSQPRCESCGGRVRPDVTLFTEGLPGDQWDGAERAVRALGPRDCMLIVGTSSVVYPAASLPGLAKAQGAFLVECNLEFPTPLTNAVDIAVAGKAAEILPAMVDRVLAARRSRVG